MIRVCLVDDQTLVRQGIRSLLALAGPVAAAHTAQAQEVTLKVHFFLPPTS